MVMQGLCTLPPLNPVLRCTLPITLGFNDLAPMFWGTLSDLCGRRPIMFACLAILSLSCVGLALVPTSAYWLLMLLRCIQATGSASTITLGNLTKQWQIDWTLMRASGAGIVGDIAAPAERGGFFGLFGIGPLVSACGLLLREVSNGLSVRLLPVLVPSSEGFCLRGLAGGTIDPNHLHIDLTVPL
jgi:MFS family permease